MENDRQVGLITGASSGLGAEFARALAPQCERLLLVARREDRLHDLAQELQDSGCEILVIAADLCSTLGLAEVIEAIRQRGPVTLLVNNAGFGTLGNFAETDLEPQVQMVDLHCNATLALCRAAIPFMQDAGGGGIINVSSLAAFNAFPGVAVYGASKRFLNYFSEALQAEVADSNIRVQALCPGYTRTEFHDGESFQDFERNSVPESMWMDSDAVVTESLEALRGGGDCVFVPGAGNRALLAKLGN